MCTRIYHWHYLSPLVPSVLVPSCASSQNQARHQSEECRYYDYSIFLCLLLVPTATPLPCVL